MSQSAGYAPDRAPPPVRILTSGFGPFPNMPQNVTQALNDRLHRHLSANPVLAGRRIIHRTLTLPTVWQAAPDRWSEEIRAFSPHVAIGFGVSRKAKGFVIETLARNVANGIDANGCLPPSHRLDPAGAAFRLHRMAPRRLVRHLRRSGIPARRSLDAGGYLCNALLYAGLDRPGGGTEPTPIVSGFVHVPPEFICDRAGHDGTRPATGLTWSEALAGAVGILSFAVGELTD